MCVFSLLSYSFFLGFHPCTHDSDVRPSIYSSFANGFAIITIFSTLSLSLLPLSMQLADTHKPY